MQLVIVVALVSPAFANRIGAQTVKEVNEHAIFGDHAHVGKLLNGLLGNGNARIQVEQIFFGAVDHDCHHHLVVALGNRFDKLQVSQCHRVKATRYNCKTHFSSPPFSNTVTHAAP